MGAAKRAGIGGARKLHKPSRVRFCTSEEVSCSTGASTCLCGCMCGGERTCEEVHLRRGVGASRSTCVNKALLMYRKGGA